MNCNGIQPMGSSPAANGWMPGKPYFLALFRQQAPEQGVNSNGMNTATENAAGIWKKSHHYDKISSKIN